MDLLAAGRGAGWLSHAYGYAGVKGGHVGEDIKE